MKKKGNSSVLFQKKSEDNNTSSDVLVDVVQKTDENDSTEYLKSEISRLQIENQRLLQMNADLILEKQELQKQLEQKTDISATISTISQKPIEAVECKQKQNFQSIKDFNAKASINVPYDYTTNYGYKSWSQEII